MSKQILTMSRVTYDQLRFNGEARIKLRLGPKIGTDLLLLID